MTAPVIASRKIRIAYVTSLLDRMGGAEKNIYDLSLNIDRERFQPFVVTFKGGEVSRSLEENRVPVLVNGVGKLICSEAVRKGWEFVRFLKRDRIDVVITYHHDADIWGGVFSRLAGVPVVISSRRDMGYQLENKHVQFYRFCHGLFRKFITVSHAVGRVISEREGIPEEKITVIHNGINVSDVPDAGVDGARLRAEYGIGENTLVIGTVGSFRSVKGQAYLVEAVRCVKEQWNDIHVMFVGDDKSEYGRVVKQRIAEWGGERYFTFVGEQRNIWPFLALFDLFVLPSESEGFSNALVEAMACGKAVIASESGGNPEVIEHRETGLLFAPGDVDELARRILTTLGNEKLRHELGAKARHVVKAEFTLDRMVRKNESLYEDLLARA